MFLIISWTTGTNLHGVFKNVNHSPLEIFFFNTGKRTNNGNVMALEGLEVFGRFEIWKWNESIFGFFWDLISSFHFGIFFLPASWLIMYWILIRGYFPNKREACDRGCRKFQLSLQLFLPIKGGKFASSTEENFASFPSLLEEENLHSNSPNNRFAIRFSFFLFFLHVGRATGRDLGMKMNY